MSVTVNPPKTPVTEGSNGVAAATVPNVCKMPGPPAPFVPTPLPNIGRSSNSPKGYSKTVTIEGNKIAIKGATFKSMGDIASKGTGGGIVSQNTEGPTSFVGPGSMDVKVEGKNVQYLSDPMLNNCGPSGTPANSATLMGVMQMSGMLAVVQKGKCPVCGKEHEAFEETTQTKADAGKLAEAFGALVQNIKAEYQAERKVQQQMQKVGKTEKERTAAGAKADELLAKVNRISETATMLGVVRCKCGKNYADQSNVTRAELCKAAKSAGLIPPEGKFSSLRSEEAASPEDMLAKIESIWNGQRPKPTPEAQKFALAWDQGAQWAAESFANLEARRSNPAIREVSAAYPPGFCAAQKTLLLLLDGKAIPQAMTEQWYNASGNPTAGMIDYEIERPGGAKERATGQFEHGKSVPPCRTCSLIVPFLVCPRGETRCFHSKGKEAERLT